MKKRKRLQKRNIKRCLIEFNDGGEQVRGISSDFSQNGLFIRSTHPMPASSIIDISIELPDGRIARLKGEVVRSSKISGKWYAGKKIVMTNEKEGMGIRILERDELYTQFASSLPD